VWLVRSLDADLDWQAVYPIRHWHFDAGTVDGRPVRLQGTDTGIIRVLLPPSSPDGSELRLSFRPPGYRIGQGMALSGLLGALISVLLWHRGHRRAQPVNAPDADTSGRRSSTGS